jgi:two-component system, NarL family, invasion response regulator UvrY
MCGLWLPSGNGTKALKILVVEDSTILRASIARLLSREIHSAEVGEAGDGAVALALFRAAAWDIVILDISMPGENGLVVLDKLQAIRPGQPVVMLTTHISQATVNIAFSRGALGYVVKEDSPNELVPAIHHALSGQRYQSQRVSSEMVSK